LSTALHGLINHAAVQESQIQKIIAAMKAAGVACEVLPEMEKFDPQQLNKLVE
jgi:serine O-acetyltransferase